MKKQYLISLLGIAAISAPVGSSLLSTSPQLGPSDPKTGLITIDSNELIAFDTSKKTDEVVSAGDKLESINIEASAKVDSEVGSYTKPSSYIIGYNDGTEDQKMEVTSEQLEGIGTVDKDNLKYSLDINSVDNSGLENIWAYEISDDDASNGFSLTAKTTTNKAPEASKVLADGEDEVELDNLKIDSVVNRTSGETTVSAEEVVATKSVTPMVKNTATVDYDISPIMDIEGKTGTIITDIEWLDLGEDGKLDEPAEGSAKLLRGDPVNPNEDTVIGTGDVNELKGTIEKIDAPEEGVLYNESLIQITSYEADEDATKAVTHESDVLGTYIIPGEPEVSLKAIYEDTTNNILSIEGSIDDKGSEIQSINIIDDSGIVSEAATIDEGNFEVHTLGYSGELSEYTLEVVYGDIESPETSDSIVLDDATDNIEPEEADLSKYLDDSSDKLGGGAIFGIIVAVFLGVGLLAGLGYWLYKKYGNKAGSKA